MMLYEAFNYNLDAIANYVSDLDKNDFLDFLNEYNNDKISILRVLINKKGESNLEKKYMVLDSLSFEEVSDYLINIFSIKYEEEVFREMLNYYIEKKESFSNRLLNYFIESKNYWYLFNYINDINKVVAFFDTLEESKIMEIWEAASFKSLDSVVETAILKLLVARGKKDIILDTLKELSDNAGCLLILMGRQHYYPDDEYIIDFIKNFIENGSSFFVEIYLKEAVVNGVITLENEAIKRNINRILNLETPISSEFKKFSQALVALPYDEDLFNKLKAICLDINDIRYLQVYLSQLIRFIAKEKDLDIREIEIRKRSSRDGYNTLASWDKKSKKVGVYHLGGRVLQSQYIMRMTESCFHELRHAYQYQNMPSIISINALMCNLEGYLIEVDQARYYKEYYTICNEMDARIYATYETYEFFKGIDEHEANEFLKESKREIYLSQLKIDKEFIKDREMLGSIEYFCSLINTFFGAVSSEKIVELRKQNKTLELITDETGRAYTLEEIEIMLNSIKSYSTNDIEFNPQDRDTKLFYTKYLHNLRYGVLNGLINFDSDSKIVRKS